MILLLKTYLDKKVVSLITIPLKAFLTIIGIKAATFFRF